MSDFKIGPKRAAGLSQKPFSVYVHVPYCRVRCGYCDFNTYTATELKGTTQLQYPAEAMREIDFADGLLSAAGVSAPPVRSIFFGGGTPTLLAANELANILHKIIATWGLEQGAEVTTEANPDTVDLAYLQELKTAGFTRVSFGMQSAVPRVLQILDRTHNPQNVARAIEWAKQAGLQVSLDLIYGAPTETLAEWRQSLESALDLDPHHISAYALIIEEGTKLYRQIKKGQVEAPDDDLQAQMYELADELLGSAGYSWYELSNWAKEDSNKSQHNMAYWQGSNWWGVGPGAHSHINGLRWWNVKHPAAYAERIARDASPALDSETLDNLQILTEEIMLKIRLADGLLIEALPASSKQRVAGLIAKGLVDGKQALKGRLVLTLRGRLLADAVTHELISSI